MADSSMNVIPELLHRVLDEMLEGFQIISDDFKYIYVNAVVARQGKRKPEELVGRSMMECYPGIEQTFMFAELKRAMAERVSVRMDNEFTYPDGSKGWFQLFIYPVDIGLLILSVDITERKKIEDTFYNEVKQLVHILDRSIDDPAKINEVKQRLTSLEKHVAPFGP